MSYFGTDHIKDSSLPRISGSRLTETHRPWQSVKFIDDDYRRDDIHDTWEDDMKQRYGKSKTSSTFYRHTKRPTSADSSATSSISSLKDSNEV